MKFVYNCGEANEENIIFEAIPQNITIPIYIPNTNGAYICCKWYRYEWVHGPSLNNIDGPMIYFYDGEFIILCNDINDAEFDKLDGYGKSLAFMYYQGMKGLAYSKDFDKFIFWNTDDPDDEDITYIKWKLGKHNSAVKSEGGKVLTITTDGTDSRAKLVLKWMMKMFSVRMEEYVALLARNLRLNDKIESFVFDDPKYHLYQFVKGAGDELVMEVGVQGTNYYSAYSESDYETAAYDTTVKSVVKYTPYMFFMDPIRQKLLFVHELVHTKIGNDHAHDKYFWHLFEVYSGYKRTADGAYRPQQEKEDTAEFDAHHNVTCDQLIAANLRTKKKAKW